MAKRFLFLSLFLCLTQFNGDHAFVYGFAYPQDQMDPQVAISLVEIQKPRIKYWAQNIHQPAESHITRRRQQRQRKTKKQDIYYKNCQGLDIYKLDSEYRDKVHKTQTEATGLCIAPCAMANTTGNKDRRALSEVISSAHMRRGQRSRRPRQAKEDTLTRDFRETLKKRVIGQIQTKIARAQALQACVTGQENQLSAKGVAKETMKKFDCPKRKKDLADSINRRWPEMRINLSLISVNADQVVTGKPYLSYPLSHEISDFGSISKLTDEEQATVKQKWAKSLSETPLDNISPNQFQFQFREGNGKFLGQALTTSDIRNLRKATEDMREESRNSYRKIIQDLPLLAYLKTGDPNNKEDMNQAFSKMETNLNRLLKTVKKEDVDMALLLSFKPLVEELIEESKGGYCLTAQKAQTKANKEQNQEQLKLVALGIVGAVPCFMGGPIGMAGCLGSGLGMGSISYKKAQIAVEESLGRVLTGRDFETMAELVYTDKALFWEIALLPTAIRGTLVGTIKFGQKLLKTAGSSSKAPKPSAVANKSTGRDGPSGLSIQDIKQYIRKNSRNLNSKYKEILGSKTVEEQDVIMTAIAKLELKGAPSAHISQKIRTAVRQCTAP